MSNINNHNPHGREGVLYSTGTIPFRHVYKTLVLSLFLTCLSFVLLPTIIASANATTEAAASVNWTPLSLALSDGGDVSFVNLVPSTDGTMEVVKKTVSVETTGKAYAVYLSMDNDSNRLHYNGDAASTLGIPATSGSFSSPATFTGRGWGYAVPDVNHFSSSGVYNSYALGENVFSSDTGYNTGLWAAVPTKDSAQKIYSGTIPSNKTNDSFDVYYAVMVDNDLIAGTYSNHLVYTALAASTSLDTVSNNLSVRNANTETSQRIVTHGDILTLNFDLTQSTAGLVAKNTTKIYLVPHNTVVAANYTLTDAIKDNKANYPVCAINNNPTDFVISNDMTAGAIINCTIGESTNGTVAGVEGNNNGAGSYDVWVNIEDYGINYFSKYLTNDRTSTLPSIIFAGLQSKDSSGYLVTKMQEMTPSVCKNTNEFGTQYGANATVYDYTGTGTALASGLDATLPSNTTTTGTFALTDTRDSKTYLVRRLADGNCWMVQNLDLDLAQAGQSYTMTKENTDITADSYTPTQYTPAQLTERTGSPARCEQFIAYEENKVDGKLCLWESMIGENGEALSTSANNSRSAIPRQYENNNDWIDNSSPNNDGAETLYRNSGTPSNTATDAAATQYMGNYYNWYAATAETGTWSLTNGNASGSICPKGWQLPGDDDSEKSWKHLIVDVYKYILTRGDDNAEGSKKMRNTPLSIIFSGIYHGGSLSTPFRRGTYAYYWNQNKSYDSRWSGNLYFGSSLVQPYSSTVDVTHGDAVRCVAR